MTSETPPPPVSEGPDASDGRVRAPPLATTPAPTSESPAGTAAFLRVFGVAVGLTAAIGATYFAPSLAGLRPWVPGSDYVPFWNVVGREWLGEGKALEAEAAAVAALSKRIEAEKALPAHPRPRADAKTNGVLAGVAVEPAPAAEPVFPLYAARVGQPVEHGIEPVEALDSYFRKLTLVDLGRPGAVARAGHWGDSALGVDGITSGIRRRLQGRFGDAGHGFHLMDRYHPAYKQQGITFKQIAPWERCFIVWDCRKDERRYGYGGLLAYSSGGSASAWSTPKEGFGRSVSRFELWFARQERGGKLEVVLDGSRTWSVDTRGPELQDDWFTLNVPPGPHSFQVRASGRGSVRAYGIVLENGGPGVVWDGMVLVGGSTRALRTQSAEHIESQIRRRDPDLIAFMFGGNDLERNYVDLKESMQPYYDEYRDVLRRFRAGKPGLACLVMSPIDHGRRLSNGDIAPKRFVKPLRDAQREIARENGCAFFDTYEATGGDGTAARWFRARPPLISPDLGHPTQLGHEVIAALVADAILAGYEQYRARMQGKPLPELAGNPANDPGTAGIEQGAAEGVSDSPL